jgi:alcohol dehydrogenase class IV
METQSDEKVAALKATLELQKIEMQAKFDQMAAQYEQLMAMVGVNQQQAQMKDLSGSVNQLAQASVDGQQQNTAQMQQLLETIS